MNIQEQPEIPAVCDRCLGPNPYLEMVRDYNGAECKLCTRPFTVFEWTPIKGERIKRTIICLTCSRAKNCCQVCMLDLTYGLDLQIRDSVMKLAGADEEFDQDTNVPVNAITKQYKADQLDAQYAKGLIKNDAEEDESRSAKARELLLKVAQSQQQQQKKTPQTLKKETPLSKEDLLKLISKLPFNGNLKEKKESKENLKSFFIFGVTDELPDYAIQNFFEKKFNTTLQSMSINHNARAGYVVFKNSSIASNIASTILQDFISSKQEILEYNRPVLVVIENVPLRICWGKTKSLGMTNNEHYKIAAVVKKQMQILADKDLKEYSLK